MIDWCALKKALESGLQGIMKLFKEIQTITTSNPPKEYARKTVTKRYQNRQHLYSKTPKTKYKPPIRRIS